jgi:cytochrome c553
MRRLVGVVVLGVAAIVTAAVLRAAEPPGWAYAIPPAAPTPPAGAPAAQPAAPDPTPRTLPGSTLSFPLANIRDAFGPADWFPGDHPAMPEVVAKGRRPEVRACSLCHYPNGKGRPENAGVSGLPVAYFIQQMHDFRSDVRKSAEPRKANTNVMIAIAKGMTEDEIKASAEYFGAIKWTPWI